MCGWGRVGAVFLPSAIWVPSSAARSVFRTVRSPGHTAVSSNRMCSRAAPVNAPSSFQLRVARVELVQLGQYFLGLLLLAGGLVGQRIAVGKVVTHDRPEVHLLQRLVLGLLDDELLGHLLAQRQLVLLAPVTRLGPFSSSASMRLASWWS